MERCSHMHHATDPSQHGSPRQRRAAGRPAPRDGRRSRDRVLQAALDLITEAGIDQVRLAGIAQRAGMSSGQVMYYFTSMEHILLETLAWREDEETRQRRAGLPRRPRPAGPSWSSSWTSTCPAPTRTRAGSSGWRHGPVRRTTGR